MLNLSVKVTFFLINTHFKKTKNKKIKIWLKAYCIVWYILIDAYFILKGIFS